MKYSEDNILIAIVAYIRAQYPKILFTHIANERKASPIQGARLKRKGVRAGMPDLLIFRIKGDWSVGMAIELKVHPNKPNHKQREILEQLSLEGWQVRVCYSLYILNNSTE